MAPEPQVNQNPGLSLLASKTEHAALAAKGVTCVPRTFNMPEQYEEWQKWVCSPCAHFVQRVHCVLPYFWRLCVMQLDATLQVAFLTPPTPPHRPPLPAASLHACSFSSSPEGASMEWVKKSQSHRGVQVTTPADPELAKQARGGAGKQQQQGFKPMMVQQLIRPYLIDG